MSVCSIHVMEGSVSIKLEVINVYVKVEQLGKTVNPLQVLVVEVLHVVITRIVKLPIRRRYVTAGKDTLERTVL